MSPELEEIEKEIAEQEIYRLSLRQRFLELERSNRLASFVPHKGQEEFLKQAGVVRRMVSAGNRFGKSTLGVVEDCCWLLGYRPFYPVGHPLRTQGIPRRGVKGLCIAQDWDKVHEIFTKEPDGLDAPCGKFFDFLPKAVIKGFDRRQDGTISAIRVASKQDTGEMRYSVICFDTVKTFKQDGMSQESSDWDFIHGDEPIPEAMWIAASRGLIDRGGHAWFLLTPLKEPWLYNWFSEAVAAGSPDFWLAQGDMTDNPTLNEKSIELFLSQLDETERECRKRGVPLAYGNLVLSTFEDAVHLCKEVPHGWPNMFTPPPDYAIALAIDTHPQTPTAVLFVAVAPTGQVYFYDELWIGGIAKDRITIVAQEILRKMCHRRAMYQLCEPAAWSEDPETGRSFVDVFEAHGLRPEKGSKARTFAIQESRMLFAQRERGVYIMPHCRVLLKEIRTWAFDKDNKPEDKNDHMCECLGRLVVHDGLAYHSPFEDSQQQSVLATYNNNPEEFFLGAQAVLPSLSTKLFSLDGFDVSLR